VQLELMHLGGSDVPLQQAVVLFGQLTMYVGQQTGHGDQRIDRAQHQRVLSTLQIGQVAVAQLLIDRVMFAGRASPERGQLQIGVRDVVGQQLADQLLVLGRFLQMPAEAGGYVGNHATSPHHGQPPIDGVQLWRRSYQKLTRLGRYLS
jgi:hypothetical protein